MKKNVLKRIVLGITTLTFSMSIFLNCDVAYSKEVNVGNGQNNAQIVIKEDIRLQDDFYEVINKEWISKTKLDKGDVSYSTFEELASNVNKKIYKIIMDIQCNRDRYDKNSDELKVLKLYENYLDNQARNKAGIMPIEKYMKEIDNINTIDDLRKILRSNEFSYFQSLINLSVAPDYKDSSVNVLYISRSNLGLGNSSYYKDYSKKGISIKEAYIKYISKLYTLYGESKKIAHENAQKFYDVEEKIARKIPSLEEEAADPNRIEKSYNVYTIKDLEEYAPNIKFSDLFNELNISDDQKIIVEDPEELKLVNSFIVEESIDEVKNFMRTTILLNTNTFLTSKFRESSSELKKLLYGVKNTELDYTSGVKFATYELEEVVSKLYVDAYFNKESKDGVENITKEIIDNFEKRLQRVTWMSDYTRLQALNKLQNINVKIGYPNKWNDYSNINIKSYSEGGSLVENTINIYLEESKKQFLKLSTPVDKDEWNMGACTVNAYYNPTNNEIVFPAGILQAPFYDKNASIEKNLGGIGAVIGHELTHAFDNTGAQFDETGKLKNWWSNKDYEEFTSRSKKISDYYSKIEISDGKFINGPLTVGENISDLGGVACILDMANKLEKPNLEDLFENYANVWKEVSTDEMKEYLLNNDPHAPKRIRVNGVLSQFDDFYKTYNIKEGDKMYIKPEDRVGIW